MPNGGSDCCGTCCFNSSNERSSEKGKEVKCKIRDIIIPNPFWTYCANHPHHNENKIKLPLGPVYVSDGYPYARKIWKQPPDNEKIRSELLYILNKIDITQKDIYPSARSFHEEIIKQVTALKEKCAITKLLQISQIDLSENQHEASQVLIHQSVIVGQAIEALLVISNGMYLKDVKHLIEIGIKINYEQEKDSFAPIRYHLIRGLQYCPQKEAKKLLQTGVDDPHSEVRAFAIEIFNNRKNK